MKTTYIKIFALLITFTGLTSCSDWLTVEPEGKIVLTEFWKKETDVDMVVATCYRSMLEEDYMKRILVWGELRSDNINGAPGVDDTEKKIVDANILPNNDYAKWSSFYSVINYCNIVLHYAPQVVDPNFTESELHAREAEVLTIRALNYFYLVRAFKNVPLLLKPFTADNQEFNIAQSTEDEVLDQLESDLLKAETWCMTTYGNFYSNKGRITKNAVRALLADIYLWRGKYQQCATYCDLLLNDKRYKLVESDFEPYMQIFSMGNSTESIFELQFLSSNNAKNLPIFNFYGKADKTDGKFCVPDFIAGIGSRTVFDNASTLAIDERRKDFIIPTPEAGMTKPYYIFKYAGNSRFEMSNGKSSYSYRSEFNSPNWIFYRITDIMLMKAEALVQLDRTTDDRKIALHYVNVVNHRSNPTTDTLEITTFPEKRDLEELVLLERQRELMFEGKRWFDLLRMARRDGNSERLVSHVVDKYTTNQSVIRLKMKTMNSLYWPIHENELRSNPKLVQNSFYQNTIK